MEVDSISVMKASFAVGGNIPKWVGCILGPTYMIQI